MEQSLVVKDNALMNAGYNLGLVEQRLILLAIVQLREHTHNMQLDHVVYNRPIEIEAASYIKAFTVDKTTAYRSLKKACKTLFDRQFSYQEQGKKGIDNITTRWVSDIRYNDSSATIAFTFTPTVLPLVTYLKGQFSKYEIEQVAELKSGYAVRLYELLIAWRAKGETPVILMADFRAKLGVDDGKYKNMGQFKARVLDNAVTQINEHTDINVKYQQHKRGRVITGFSFKFKFKKPTPPHLGTEEIQESLALNKDADKPNKAVIQAEFKGLQDLAKLSDGNVRDLASVQQIERFKSIGLM